MQGRQGEGNNGPPERPSDPHSPLPNGTGRYRSVNGTGRHPAFSGTSKLPSLNETGKGASLNLTNKQRAIPQRPPGMARLSSPPETQRVPRPQRELQYPQNLRKRLILFSVALVVIAVIAFPIGYFLFQSLNISTGSGSTVTDFLTALSNKDYDSAYKDLGPAITIPTSPQQFTKQAQVIDSCYGPIKDYSEAQDSATNQDNIQSLTYNITRTKLSKSYQMHIRLQQDQNDQMWKIVDYGDNLGPTQSPPPCAK